MSNGLSSRNVQAIVSADVHKVLRDAAYDHDMPLRDLIASVLSDYAKKVVESQLKMRELNSP